MYKCSTIKIYAFINCDEFSMPVFWPTYRYIQIIDFIQWFAVSTLCSSHKNVVLLFNFV